MKEDWDVNMIKESSAEHFENREANPFRSTKFFFVFDLKDIPSRMPYSRKFIRKGNKKIFYYGK